MKPRNGISQDDLETAHIESYADEGPTDDEIEEAERMEELEWGMERESRMDEDGRRGAR
jgi:hypothetical protein